MSSNDVYCPICGRHLWSFTEPHNARDCYLKKVAEMSDEELAAFLGIAGHPKRHAVIAALSPAKRALFDRMAGLEMEVELWQAGLGPKPTGVLIDTERTIRPDRPLSRRLRGER